MTSLKFTVKQIASILGGTTEGNPNTIIHKITKIDAGEEGGLAFLIDKKFEPYIYTTVASAVIVKDSFVAEKELPCAIIRLENPQMGLIKLLQFYETLRPQKLGVAKSAHIAKTAKIGNGVYIGEGVVVGENVEIGDNSKIHPLCYLGDNVIIGEENILYQAKFMKTVISSIVFCIQCVIGADGFVCPTKTMYEKFSIRK